MVWKAIVIYFTLLPLTAIAFVPIEVAVPSNGRDSLSIRRAGVSPLETEDSSSRNQKDVTANSMMPRVFSRRGIFTASVSGITAAALVLVEGPEAAIAVGPIKIVLEPTSYSAVICPPDRPIPGEKAMVGMRGLCVTVKADLQGASPKDLEKVGVYGFVADGESGDSVLANNPDGASDAGQFAMIESVTTTDKTVVFEFIAAVPKEKDLSKYANGIGPLEFSSLRIISYPGGQQFGAISPCEYSGTCFSKGKELLPPLCFSSLNAFFLFQSPEFSEECEAWEAENGPWKKADYMIKSNPRTMGR